MLDELVRGEWKAKIGRKVFKSEIFKEQRNTYKKYFWHKVEVKRGAEKAWKVADKFAECQKMLIEKVSWSGCAINCRRC
jgi:hypothetical protein